MPHYCPARHVRVPDKPVWANMLCVRSDISCKRKASVIVGCDEAMPLENADPIIDLHNQKAGNT